MRSINKIKLTLIREKIAAYDESMPMVITNKVDAYAYFKDLGADPQETVRAIYLDAKNKVIGIYDAARGTTTTTITSPADIIRPALLCGAPRIIIGHNHPSGHTKPSKEDIHLTKMVLDACNIMELELLDHIIIGEDDFLSMKSEGFFNKINPSL